MQEQESILLKSDEYIEIHVVGIHCAFTSKDKKDVNWIQTVPGKAWFVLFRTYGPFEPWFDKTWQLNDFELIN